MTHLPPDPPVNSAGAPPLRNKFGGASLLTAPRPPVTRWNRKYLVAGAGVLALLVGLGFFVGLGGAHTPKPREEDPQANVDTSTVQTPPFAQAVPTSYADLKNTPGVTSLPPPGTPIGATAANATAAGTPAAAQATAAPPVDPAVQQAREQARAAPTSGPFFGEASPQSTAQNDGGSASLAQLAGAQPDGAISTEEVQPGNGQAAKAQFARTARADDYLENPLRGPLSPYEVKAGTIIPAALLTALNSDLPGEVIAQVTEPVFDHVTGRTVLIPQGSRLIGKYDSQVAYGQNRAMIAWNRIIMPNGRSINIGSMTGADLTGAAGLQDRTDAHGWQLAKGILLSTIFSVGAASAQDASARSSGGLVLSSAGSGVANEAEQVGSQITARDLNRQPTIRVRAGWPLRVIVNKDMILAPYE